MLPVHNSTFDLSIHAWYEPMQKVSEYADIHEVDLVTPVIGEPVIMGLKQVFRRWWQALMPAQALSESES